MKRLTKNSMLIALTISLFVGCEKEDDISLATESNETTEVKFEIEQKKYLTIPTIENYDFAISELNQSLYDLPQKEYSQKIKSDMERKDLTDQEIKELLQSIIITPQEIIDHENKIVSRIIPNKNYTSILDLYHEALKIDDAEQLKLYINNHSDYLVLNSMIQRPQLKFDKALSSIMNMEGKFQVEDKIHEYTKNSHKISDVSTGELLTETDLVFNLSSSNNENSSFWGPDGGFLNDAGFGTLHPAFSNCTVSNCVIIAAVFDRSHYEVGISAINKRTAMYLWYGNIGSFNIIPGLFLGFEDNTHHNGGNVISKIGYNTAGITKTERISDFSVLRDYETSAATITGSVLVTASLPPFSFTLDIPYNNNSQ